MKKIQNKYTADLTNSEYHKTKKGLSSSLLKKGLISLAHLKVERERPEEPVVRLGSLIHSLILEAGALPKGYQIKIDGRTKEGRQQLETANLEGFYLVNPKDLTIALETYVQTKNNPIIDLLKDLEKEVSGFAVDPLGFVVKIRPDAIDHKLKRIYDVKSVSNCMTEYALGSLTYKNGWLIQAAWYVYVNKLITGEEYEFKHIFVETEPPYGVRLRTVPMAMIEKVTEDIILPFLPKYNQALQTDIWPCYDAVDKLTNIPGYVLSDEIEGMNIENGF